MMKREASPAMKRENPTPGKAFGVLSSCQLTVFHETADSDFSMGWEIRIS
jgi:hypothetical protein